MLKGYKTYQIHVEKASEALLLRALERYNSFNDKEWSLTDCLSFEVTDENSIFLTYSSDNDFEQADFNMHYTDMSILYPQNNISEISSHNALLSMPACVRNNYY